MNADRVSLRKYWERTGCLLTADGSLDDRVHLHSGVALGALPAVPPTVAVEIDEDGKSDEPSQMGLGGGQYTYMYAGDSEGKDEKKEEKEGKRGERAVKIEDPDNIRVDDDEPDLDDEDDPDEQLREASLRDALPAGWKVIDEPPSSLDSSLVTRMLAMRWSVTGWCSAKVHRHYARAKGAKGLNYELQYTLGGEIVEHRLRIADYGCSDDAAVGAWCLLSRVPVAPPPPPAPAAAASAPSHA